MVTTGSPTARLLLDPQELAVLRGCLPQGMREGAPPAGVPDKAVLAGLRGRHVIDADGTIARSILAALVMLADPNAVRLSVIAAGPVMARRTSIALSDQLLAGLTLEEPSGRAEQFLSPTAEIATEVVRLLPALGLPAGLDRAAQRDIEPGPFLVAVQRAQRGHGHDPAMGTREGGTARAFADGFLGSLSVTLSLPARSVADEPVLDRLLWVATMGGWWSLRPHTGRDGRALLDVVPVVPGQLAGELAPMVAAAALALGGTASGGTASGGTASGGTA